MLRICATSYEALRQLLTNVRAATKLYEYEYHIIFCTKTVYCIIKPACLINADDLALAKGCAKTKIKIPEIDLAHSIIYLISKLSGLINAFLFSL